MFLAADIEAEPVLCSDGQWLGFAAGGPSYPQPRIAFPDWL